MEEKADLSVFLRIDWDKFCGTSKQKQVFKYLTYRVDEIKDRNRRYIYSEMVDITAIGSLKKAKYQEMFNAFVHQISEDKEHKYILEGAALYVEANMPLKTIKGDKLMCAICLEKFGPGTIEILGCEHAFHSKCIIPWYEKKSWCPLCRQ